MSTDARRPVADGVVAESRSGRDLIRFERRLAHPVEAVWSALTEPDELIRWWGEAQVELTEGGRFVVRWLNTDEDGNVPVLEASITKLEPNRLLELTGEWGSEAGESETTTLRWEVRPDGEGAVLIFENELDLPEEHDRKTVAGWHWHLDALAEALEGKTADLANNPGWERLHELYGAEISR